MRDAGALGLAGTAASDGLALLGPLEGSTVLISGATGGVGAIAVELAAAQGARVIATAKSGSESGFVSALTAAEVTVIDYTQDVTAQSGRSPPAAWTRCCTSPATWPSSPRSPATAAPSPPP
ncbi:hypothetical protein ABZ568_10180 [Streptomyces olindensis]|uniref:Uncharacterized protein n=1 Tax=Streptomyces olindensis TaxID=358823 RepID=A0ABV2XRZ2_9ACTN